MSRHASIHNKRDIAEPEILGALASMGVTWIEVGPLDGWAWIDGRYIPIECKTGNAPLRPSQKAFIAESIRLERPYLVLRSVEDAINAVIALRRTGRAA